MSIRRGRGPGHLSDEDVDLWRHVTHSVERARLKPRNVAPGSASQVHRGSSVDAEATIKAARSRLPPPGPAQNRPTSTPQSSPHHGPQPAVSVTPATAMFERKRARRIASGRLEIDARIDLHGMRQSEAHHALIAFLRKAYANGHRNVLVITGKGGVDAEGRMAADHGEGPRGVLKRNVPRWLGEPELRQIVVSYTTAARHHGGEGALYVQVRARGAVAAGHRRD